MYLHCYYLVVPVVLLDALGACLPPPSATFRARNALCPVRACDASFLFNKNLTLKAKPCGVRTYTHTKHTCTTTHTHTPKMCIDFSQC